MKLQRLKHLLLLLPALLAGCAGGFGGSPLAELEIGQSRTDITDQGDGRNRARANTELASLYYERGNLGVALEVLRVATSAWW